MLVSRSCSHRGASTGILTAVNLLHSSASQNQRPPKMSSASNLEQNQEAASLEQDRIDHQNRHFSQDPATSDRFHSSLPSRPRVFNPSAIQELSQSLQHISFASPTTSATQARPEQRKAIRRHDDKLERERKVQPSKASGGIPSATSTYIRNSSGTPTPLQEPQGILVVIDLNGTLLFRPQRKNPTKFIARPHAQRFLQYCIETFTVVIWSSARPENVRNMCDMIMTPELRSQVAAIWGRDKFNLSQQDYNLRVQCYKRLTQIWSDPTIARMHPESENGRQWDQTNTVLVDDSLEKGKSEPFNLIEIPEFAGNLNETGDILPQVHDYLNQLSLHSNVSAFLRQQPFKAQAAPAGPPR